MIRKIVNVMMYFSMVHLVPGDNRARAGIHFIYTGEMVILCRAPLDESKYIYKLIKEMRKNGWRCR